jgi:hypothetical protein
MLDSNPYYGIYNTTLSYIPQLCQIAAEDKNSGLGDFKELLEYLKSQIKDENEWKISSSARKRIYADALARVGYYEEAILIYEGQLNVSLASSIYDIPTLNSMYNIYLNLKDSKKAEKVLNKIKEIEFDDYNNIGPRLVYIAIYRPDLDKLLELALSFSIFKPTNAEALNIYKFIVSNYSGSYDISEQYALVV